MLGRRRRRERHPAAPSRQSGESGESDLDHVTRLARHHLPPDVAERWLGLLRPALRLVPGQPGRPVVARLGGLPLLPLGTTWPEASRALSYVGELWCAPLAGHGLGVPLPPAGRLLFFYDLRRGESRVLHVRDDDEVAPLAAPARAVTFGEQHLAAEEVVTFPRDVTPWFDGEELDAEELVEALDERHPGGPWHQVGGWAAPVQGPVEPEAAHAALGGSVGWDDPRHVAEEARWRLVLQVDSDRRHGMMWGDAGTLYWLSDGSGLAAGDPSAVRSVFQCY